MKTVFVIVLTAAMYILISAGYVYAGSPAKLADDSFVENTTTLTEGETLRVDGTYRNSGDTAGSWVIQTQSTDTNTVTNNIDGTCSAGEGFKTIAIDTSGCSGCTSSDVNAGTVDISLGAAQTGQVINWIYEACSGASNQDPYTIITIKVSGDGDQLNTATASIIVNPAVSDDPPNWSANSTNSTLAGTWIEHRVYWEDDTALSGYNFSFCNGTWDGNTCAAGWLNDSWVSMTGAGNWSNVTKFVNITVGVNVSWQVHANDSEGQWNSTDVFVYNTTALVDNPPYYNTTSGYLGVNDTTPNPGDTVQYYSWWYDDNGLSNYTLEWNETGSWVNQTWQNSPGNNTWHNYTIQVPTGAEGKFISAKIWANDSQNQFNSTTLVNITVQNVAPTVSNTAVNDTEVGKNDSICINATATDVGVGIDDVWAMITYPNGTEINATMSDTGPSCSGSGGDDWYGVNFNVGDTGGTLYVNTSYANDTLGNEGFQDPFPDVAVTVLNNVSFKIKFLNGSEITSSLSGSQGYDQNITADNGSHKYADPCLNNEPECQTVALAVLRFNNTGDTATNWSVRLNQSLPSSIVLWGSKDSDPDTNIQLISDTAWTIINTSVCVNCEEEFWIWANFTDAAIADEIILRLNNTANDF